MHGLSELCVVVVVVVVVVPPFLPSLLRLDHRTGEGPNADRDVGHPSSRAEALLQHEVGNKAAFHSQTASISRINILFLLKF